MLITITNKEMLFLLDTITTHKVKLTIRIMLCNQEMENIQLCLVNKKINMTYQKMHKISQTLPTIINREMFFQLVTITTHKVKLTSKTMLCNQEMENIQLCLMKRKIRRNTSINTIINTITKKYKMTKIFK
jgi:hypothetical protein